MKHIIIEDRIYQLTDKQFKEDIESQEIAYDIHGEDNFYFLEHINKRIDDYIFVGWCDFQFRL